MENHRFKLTKFDPNDYSLGDVLYVLEEPNTSSLDDISAALSLYFQWPRERRAVVYSSNGTSHPCTLICDEDELEISSLFVKLDNQSFQHEFGNLSTIRIMFEVFNTCFELECDIIEAGTISNDWHFAVSLPDNSGMKRYRQPPRHQVPDEFPDKLEVQTLSGKSKNAKLIEITWNSVIVEMEDDISAVEISSVKWNGKIFNATLYSIDAKRAVLELTFTSEKESSDFFELYRKIVYPHLKPRDAFDGKEIIELYARTGFFDKFLPPDEYEATENEILETWENLKSDEHVSVADYVAVDESGKPIGVSGLVKAFYRKGLPLWIFNQLCIETAPELLERSRDLYLWRCDYLNMKPGNFMMAVRYASKGRWLDRVYTKFAMRASGLAEIIPIKSYRKTISGTSSQNDCITGEITIGTYQRPYIDEEKLMGAVLPGRLNLVTALDAIYSVWETHPQEFLDEKARCLVSAAGLESLPILFAVLPDAEVPEDVFIGKTDRFLILPKSVLADLAASICHVIAVIRRKLGVY